jgi:chromosome segregation ATPase
MGINEVEILISLLSAVLSLLAGSIAGSRLIQRYLKRLLGKEEEAKPKSYSQRLAELTESLMKASSEVDNLLAELAQVAEDREEAVKKLESELTQMEQHEEQLQKRIEELKGIPVPVAEHFAQLIEQGEKRSAWRDYMLFGLGVVVSTVVAIILSLVGL